MRGAGRLAVAAVLAAGLGPMAVAAQNLPLGRAETAILTVDRDSLFAASAWGRRFAAETEAAAQALAAENARLKDELLAEEQALTDRRAGMTPEAFRDAADAFDARSVEIRRSQDAKERELLGRRAAEQQRFYATVLPLIGAVMRERGALAILDRRSVFLSVEAIDVTEELVRRIDAEHGDGTALPAQDR